MKKKIYINICLLSILTIVMTTVLTLLVCYNQFFNQIKAEVKKDALLIATQLKGEENPISYLGTASVISKRISLISYNGTVIFDNTAQISTLENHGGRPEILSAQKEGFGEIVRFSDTLKQNTFYYTLLLSNGMVLRVASTMDSIFSMFVSIIPIIVLITLVILLIALFSAMKLTKNIIAPINQINLDSISIEKTYDELLPFIKRIAEQNQKINVQMEELKAQKVRLNTISENMNEGLIVTDNSGLILSANNSALKIFGLPKENVINKSLLHLTREPEVIEYVKYALKGSNGTKTIYIHKNTFELFYCPVFENNAVFGTILLFFDISEKERVEQIRREFSANVSHELKTPITTILGYSQMINNGMAKPEDVQSFTLKIEKEAGRLITLIEDIIKLSKLDEHNSAKEFKEVNLLDLTKEVIQSLENRWREKGIEINIKSDDTYVSGVPSMLEELVFNLCDNAIKYNKDGGRIDIFIGNREISVSDTGIGISKENQERIFERFYRADISRSKKISGTGLGLSIVKHIVLFHSGEIAVESDLGKGTKMTVRFP